MNGPTFPATVPVINSGSTSTRMAGSEKLCSDMNAKVASPGPTVVISGSLEMDAQAHGVWRVLVNKETAPKHV